MTSPNNDPLLRILRGVAGDLVAGRGQRPDTKGDEQREDPLGPWMPLIGAVGSEVSSFVTRVADSAVRPSTASTQEGDDASSAEKPTAAPGTKGSRSGGTGDLAGLIKSATDVGLGGLDVARRAAEMATARRAEQSERRSTSPTTSPTTVPDPAQATAQATVPPEAKAGVPAEPVKARVSGRLVGSLGAAELGHHVTISTSTGTLKGILRGAWHGHAADAATSADPVTDLTLSAVASPDVIELRLSPDTVCFVDAA